MLRPIILSRSIYKPAMLLLVLITLLWRANAIAQTDTARINGLKKDLKELQDSLLLNYPSLYRYQTQAKVEQLFASYRNLLTSGTTDLQLLNMVKQLFSVLGDGHLYVGTSQGLDIFLKQKAVFFPVKLYFKDNKVFLQTAVSDACPSGTELLSIDGISIERIRKQLYKSIGTDGHIETKKRIILNNVFHFYYLLNYGEKHDFTLRLKPPNTTFILTEVVSAVPQAKIPLRPIRQQERKLLSLSINNDRSALLVIRTFDPAALTDQKLDFQAFVKRAFEQIKNEKVERLIIDLRGNGGGRDLYGALLYSYLAEKPFLYYNRLSAKTSRLPYGMFTKAASSFNDLAPSMLEKVGDHFELKNEAHDNLRLQQPATTRFNGQVLFLIDGETFSTAAEFCTVAKSLGRGKFLGEETGGASGGNTSGASCEFVLSYSKLRISFGLIQYDMATRMTRQDRGIRTDQTLVPSIADLISGRDVVLEYAYQLLQ